MPDIFEDIEKEYERKRRRETIEMKRLAWRSARLTSLTESVYPEQLQQIGREVASGNIKIEQYAKQERELRQKIFIAEKNIRDADKKRERLRHLHQYQAKTEGIERIRRQSAPERVFSRARQQAISISPQMMFDVEDYTKERSDIDIKGDIDRFRKRTSKLQRELVRAFRKIDTPEGKQQFRRIRKKIREETRKGALAYAALREQKRTGIDLASIREKSSKIVQQIQEERRKQGITERVQQRGVVDSSREQLKTSAEAAAVQEKIIDATKQATVSDRARVKEVESTREDIGKLKEQIKTSTETAAIKEKIKEPTEKTLVDKISKSTAEAIKPTQIGSLADEANKLRIIEDKFLEAVGKFEKELKETGNVSKDLRDSLSSVTKEYKEQKDIVKEINKQETGRGGGGDGPSRLARASQTAMLAGSIVQAGADIYRNATVTSEIADIQNKTNLTRIVNMPFMDAIAAARGDMSALRRLNTPTYSKAMNLALENFRQAQNAVVAGEAGQGLSALGEAGVIAAKGVAESRAQRIAKGAGSVGLGLAGKANMIMTGIGIVSDIASAVTHRAPGLAAAEIDREKRLSATAAATQSFDVEMARNTEQNRILDITMQAFRDNATANYQATFGTAGSLKGYSQLFNMMQSPTALSTGSLAFMSPQEQREMIRGSISAGGQFTRMQQPQQQTYLQSLADIQYKYGIATTEQAQQAFNPLLRIGATQQHLENLTRAAARYGIGGEQFVQMGRAVESLAAPGASMGVSLVGGVQTGMFGALEAMRRGGSTNETLNINAAFRATEDISRRTSDVGFNYAAVREISKYQQMGAQGRTAISMAEMPIEAARELQQKIKAGKLDEARSLAEQYKVSSMFFDENGKIDPKAAEKAKNLVTSKKEKFVDQFALMMPKDIREKAVKGENVSIGELDKAGISRVQFEAMRGGVAPKIEMPDREKDLRGEALQPVLQKGISTGAERKLITEGQKALGGPDAAMSTITGNLINAVSTLNNIAKLMETAAKASGEYADPKGSDISKSVGPFNQAVDKFSKACDNLLEKSKTVTPEPPKASPINKQELNKTLLRKSG